MFLTLSIQARLIDLNLDIGRGRSITLYFINVPRHHCYFRAGMDDTRYWLVEETKVGRTRVPGETSEMVIFVPCITTFTLTAGGGFVSLINASSRVVRM